MPAEQDNYERMTIRLPRGVHSALKDAARSNRRSLNGELTVILEDHLKTETADASAKSAPTV